MTAARRSAAPVEAGLPRGEELILDPYWRADFPEGLATFLEKRTPVWMG